MPEKTIRFLAVCLFAGVNALAGLPVTVRLDVILTGAVTRGNGTGAIIMDGFSR